MTTTDDADRGMLTNLDDLGALIDSFAFGDDGDCELSFRRCRAREAAGRILAAGFRRARSAPTPPAAGSDADEQIAYWQRAAHEIEQELTKERDAAVQRAEQAESRAQRWEDRCEDEEIMTQRDAALADAAALRNALTRVWQIGDIESVRIATAALAATTAPAAKEGERCL